LNHASSVIYYQHFDSRLGTTNNTCEVRQFNSRKASVCRWDVKSWKLMYPNWVYCTTVQMRRSFPSSTGSCELQQSVAAHGHVMIVIR
jgi:hypothetical protein